MGHGWVVPNADGSKARCGGPKSCLKCFRELTGLGPAASREGCAHENFVANVNVGRLSHEAGGPITGYCADVTVKCADCGLPFRFIGLAAGNHWAEPRVSVDGEELRAPIEPAAHQKFLPTATYTMPPRGKD